MPTRIVTSSECEQLAEWGDLIDTLDAGHRALSSGGAVQPVPQRMRTPGDTTADGAAVVPMMALASYLDLVAVKMLIDAPRNRSLGLPAQRSTVSLYSASTGECLAIVDGRALTRLRTAAVTALASRALARPDSHSVGLIGAGALAEEHAIALSSQFALSEVKVWSRSGESASTLAEKLRTRGISARAVGSAEESVRGSDIVCTLTPATAPVLEVDWLSPGQHVNAVGSPPRPGYRELSAETVGRADRVVVDSRDIALHESDNIALAQAAGQISEAEMVELGDVLLDQTRGRSSADDLTLFNSVGIGLQDLAAAAYFVDRATRCDIGELVSARG